MSELRAYQVDVVDRVVAAMADGASPIVLQLGTGAGKTHCAAHILARAVAAGYRCAFVAHLDTLLVDTVKRLRAAGVWCGVIKADEPRDPLAKVQVCSTATLAIRGELPPADLVILDECHRAEGPTVKALLKAYPSAVILGLTATPSRGDGRPLGEPSGIFRTLIQGPSVRELQALGHLVPIDVLAPASGSLEAMGKHPVDALADLGRGALPAIVFASTLSHADSIRTGLQARGIRAELFTGETSGSVREELRAGIRGGEVDALVSVAALVEGFDEPSIRTVVLARKFGVVGAFLQAIGRGSRPSPATGKTRCTVLDLYGAVWLHGLPEEPRAWSLTGAACRRTEVMVALQRCKACLAVFAPASACPRCGEPAATAERIPRVLTRAERLANISELPQHVRDAKYLAQLRWVAERRIGLHGVRAEEWARRAFERRFSREPQLREAS